MSPFLSKLKIIKCWYKWRNSCAACKIDAAYPTLNLIDALAQHQAAALQPTHDTATINMNWNICIRRF
jgi:hypothetical protein